LEPRTEIELEVASILSRVLKQSKIGFRDNFFRLGGNSLLAAQVIVNVQRAFGIDIPMRSAFEFPTVEGLAREIENQIVGAFERRRNTTAASEDAIAKRPDTASVEASEEQRRIWLHGAMAGRTELYNEPFTLQYLGDLNISAFERSLNEILRRHEAWRTSFEMRGERVFQNVAPELHVILPFDDLRALAVKHSEKRVAELLAEDSRLQFDLEQAPLFRVRLVRVADQDFRLLLVAHHLIADGVSVYQILVSELQACYVAFVQGREPSLPPLPFQYPDYAEWQRKSLAHRDLERRFHFWDEQFGGGLPVLNLPLDRPRSMSRELDGGSTTFRISKDLTLALKNIGESCQATLFMTLLAGLHLLLYKCTNDTDQVVGSAISTRKQLGTENLLGLFINTVVLRTKLSPQDSFLELIRRVRETTLEVLTYDVAFDALVRRFGSGSVPSITPLFQVMFVFEPSTALPSREWRILQTDLEHTVPKSDLYLQVEENCDELVGRFTYCRDIFDSQSIVRVKQLWNDVLSSVAANPNRSLADVSNSLGKAEAARKSPLSWLRQRMKPSA
jgi:acyl carrier protein